MIAVQKPMKGFTASRSTGIDLPDMRERYLSRNVNIGERFAEDPRKTRYSQVARSYRFSNFESFSLAGAFQGGRINCGYSIVICTGSSS